MLLMIVLCFFLMIRRPPRSTRTDTLFPYTTLFRSADLDAAVAGAMISKYRNTGQTCVCANRLLVHDKVYDAFAAKLVEATRRLKTGQGFEDDVTQGPLINKDGLEKVERSEEHTSELQ